MKTIRRIYDAMPTLLPIPKALVKRKVEVVFRPLEKDEERPVSHDWIGKWAGEPIVRPEQGIFENREPLR